MPPKRKRDPSEGEGSVAASNADQSVYEKVCDTIQQDWSHLQERLESSRAQATDHAAALNDTLDLVQATLVSALPGELTGDVILAIRDQIVQDSILSMLSGNEPQYTDIFDRLDASLACSSLGLCSETLPHTTLELLFENETVQGAERLFDFVESRSEQITAGLEPKKLKALVILRFCNELLRRLSKSTHRVFSGRILMFLSNAFPIGDQSAVNLRGTYDLGNVTILEDPKWTQEELLTLEIEEEREIKIAEVPQEQSVSTMEIDVKEGDELKHEPERKVEIIKRTVVEARGIPEPDFYTLFWSLQRFFAYPPHLLQTEPLFPFQPPTPPTFNEDVIVEPIKSVRSHLNKPCARISEAPSSSRASPAPSASSSSPSRPNLDVLRYAAERIISRFSAANKHEKELAGASSTTKSASQSSKLSATDPQKVKENYFFPKFLTSRNLLELQIADSFFRRQILVQLLVIFQYLRGFSASERLKALKIENLNKTLAPHALLDDFEMKWLAELNSRVHLELRATPPDGDRFAATVQLIFQREQHWISWKLASCKDFVRQPLDEIAVSKEVKAKKQKLMQPIRAIIWNVGNPTLSKLWNVGSGDVFDLSDLEHNTLERDVEELRTKIDEETAAQEDRKKALTVDGKAPTAKQMAEDSAWAASEDRKFSLAWRALRSAATEDLALFSRFERKEHVASLLQKIEDTKKEAAARLEKASQIAQAEEMDVNGSSDSPAVLESAPHLVSQADANSKDEGGEEAPDGDIQMADAQTAPGILDEEQSAELEQAQQHHQDEIAIQLASNADSIREGNNFKFAEKDALPDASEDFQKALVEDTQKEVEHLPIEASAEELDETELIEEPTPA